MFGPVRRGAWGGKQWTGWWGDTPPYHYPVFILTHHSRDPVEVEGVTTFNFVTDGIESALEQAKKAAGGKDVRLWGGGGHVAQQYLAAGLLDELELHVVPLPEQLPVNKLHFASFRLYRGRLRVETGSPERGVEELLQVGETVRLIPHDNPSSIPWRSWAAEGLLRLDRNEEARALAEEELALARGWGDPHTIGASLRVLGLVERGTAGIGLLHEAVEVLAGSEARLEHARALVDLGAALRRANQRTEARERLREGADLAQRLGAFGLAERANEETAATGARPRKVLHMGLDALTASGRRVAQLAADGMSNKEIAQTLFVTIKTVEVHLSHAYRKLEISSRAQLDKALLTPTPGPAPTSA